MKAQMQYSCCQAARLNHAQYHSYTHFSIAYIPASLLCANWLTPKGQRVKAIGTQAAAGSEQQTATATLASAAPPQVVLTREAGKNGKLLAKLRAQGVTCLEMPLIETARGPERDQLPRTLQEETFDWVCITSPEAAAVFVEGWRQAGRPAVRIAAVGEGTGRVLVAAEGKVLAPAFMPTVANAEHFAAELPGVSGRVLYPASNKASSQLQAGLAARGFDVIRLNTYDTLPVETLDNAALQLARQAAVVAVASPSAVKAWVQFAGEASAARVAMACIGSTSARAAQKLGLPRIFYPDEPSVDNFAKTIMEALGSIEQIEEPL